MICYSGGMKPSLVIAGLGNPGASYERTRHNIGFQAVDVLSEAFGQGAWKEQQKFKALALEARVVAAPALLVKPLTFMNLSGESLRKIVDFYKLQPGSQLIVLCDDIDLDRGTLRLRLAGGPGTHNGLKSIVEQFGESFPRIRIGIGPKPEKGDLAAWVLSIPPAEEAADIARSLKALPDLIREFVLNGGTPKTIA